MKLKRHITITYKLILYFVFLGIGTISVIGFYSFYYARDALMSRTFNQLTSVRVEKNNNIERYFNERTRDVSIVSITEEVQKMLKILNQNENFSGTLLTNNNITNEFNNFFRNYLFNGQYYRSVILNNKKGAYIKFRIPANSTSSLLSIDSINLTEKKTLDILVNKVINSKKVIIYESDNDINKTQTVYVGSIITDYSGAFIGTIIFELSVNQINKIMTENYIYNGLGITGESYIVGPDNCMRSDSRFIFNSVYNIKVNTKATINAFNNKSGTNVIRDYRNNSVLSSYSRLNIPGLNWIILTEIDMNEVMKPIYSIRNNILLISLIMSIIIFGIAFFVSKKITFPLNKLRKAAIKIGRGDFDNYIEIQSNDEIGSLTNSFNIMSQRLKEQTQKLKEREQRLSHFYNATIDGIILHDDEKLILINHALINITGYTEPELMNMNLSDIIDINDSDQNKSFYETIVIKKDKSKIPVEVQKSNIEYDGKVIKALVIRDITKRKNMEKELRFERIKHLRSMIDGQEYERQRLSRELHDGLGQIIIALKLKLESTVHSDFEHTREIVNEVKKLINNIIDEIRRISNNLMPAVLDEFGLINAIRTLCDDIMEQTNIVVEYQTNAISDNINKNSKIYLFRIAQEALTNIVKHSSATIVKVNLIKEEKTINIIIEDNGKGFNIEETSKQKGNGIYNMRERVGLLQGKISINSILGKGTTINIVIPG